MSTALTLMLWLLAARSDWAAVFEQLGGTTWRERDQAERRLVLAGRTWGDREFHRALHGGLESRDKEIRRRCERIRDEVLGPLPTIPRPRMALP